MCLYIISGVLATLTSSCAGRGGSGMSVIKYRDMSMKYGSKTIDVVRQQSLSF